MSQVATSTFYMVCWGCNKTLPRLYISQEDYDRQIQELMMMGWQRRTFGPAADPWFCSKECAHNSYNAKTAETWWAKKRAKDKMNRLVVQVIAGGYLLVGLIVFMVAVIR